MLEQLALTGDLGLGDDLAHISLIRVDLLGDTSFNLEGQFGADTIQANLVDVLLSGDLNFALGGGIGADTVGALVELHRGSGGSLAGQVNGNLGNDALLFELFGDDDLALLEAILDGGFGFDTCHVTRNVEVIGCER